MDRLKKSIVELSRISIEGYKKEKKIGVSILADNVRSLQNVGSIFRTADAFAIDEIILCGISGVPPHTELLKTSLGAEKSVAWRYVADAYEETLALREKGKKICVLEQAHGSISLENFEPESGKQYVVVVGNEVEGVDQRIVSMADIVVEIPQCGTKHSLNVSVSAGIVMWHFFSYIHQRKENKHYICGIKEE